MMTSKHAIALLVFLLAFGASAQESTTSETTKVEAETEVQQEETKQGRIEKIEVTGSHIKRIDIEGPSPVLTLDREYLQKSGHNSAADIIRETTVSVFGGLRETALNGGAHTGSAAVGLRGSDSTDILVLMDGKRMTAVGGGQTIDLNLIPTESLERVDILKDGASALYGSDALGGVINFITRKDYDGFTTKVRYTHAEDGAGPRTDASAVYGNNFSKGNFLAVIQYRGNEEIKSTDKDYAIATRPFYSPTSNIPAWKNESDSSYTSPGCTDPFEVGHPQEGRCRFDYSQYSWVTPEIQQYSALLSGNYEITGSTKVFARLNATQRNVTSQLAPAPGRLDVSQNTANTQWGLGATEDIFLVYRTVDEGGPRVNKIDSLGLNAVVGVGGYFSDTWDWEFSTSYSSSDTRNKQASGYFNQATLLTLADNGTFNPFDSNPDDLSAANLVGYRDIFSDIVGVQTKVTGELFELGEGPVSGAFGLSSNWISYKEDGDPVTLAGNNWGGTAAQGQASRSFQSFFMEFGANPLKAFEVQLAGRVDRYNDFGTAVNPKLALRCTPIMSLLFRASWGTGFKAPSLDDLYGGGGFSFPFARDETLCQTNGGGDPNHPSCAPGQFLTQRLSNPNIKEEKSSSINLGTLWQPTQGLSISGDYFINNKDNIAGIATANDILRAEQRPDLGLAYLQSLNFDVVRNGGQISQIVAPSTNIGKRELEGVELAVNYAFSIFSSWRMALGTNHTQMVKYKIEPFPGFGLEDRLRWPGNPAWKNNIFVGVFNGTHNMRVMARTVDGQYKNMTDPGCCGEVPIYTEYDLNYTFNGSWGGAIEFGLKNIANTNPPQDEWVYGSNGFLNTSLYNPYGRLAYLGYSHTF